MKIINKRKLFQIALLIVIAVISMTVIAKIATSPATYKYSITSIDDKKATIMAITAASAATSTALALVPGDATSPIAEQILELSSCLLIIVCVLVLEKSLITVMGYISFCIIIPIACVILCICIFKSNAFLKMLALKLIAFALILVFIIPISMRLGDAIYEVNSFTVEQLTEGNEETQIETEQQGWLQSMLSKIKDGVSDALEKAKTILNNFIDAIAVFIISYCVIPIAVFAFMFWIIKLLFGISIPVTPLKKLPLIKKSKAPIQSTDLDVK